MKPCSEKIAEILVLRTEIKVQQDGQSENLERGRKPHQVLFRGDEEQCLTLNHSLEEHPEIGILVLMVIREGKASANDYSCRLQQIKEALRSGDTGESNRRLAPKRLRRKL